MELAIAEMLISSRSHFFRKGHHYDYYTSFNSQPHLHPINMEGLSAGITADQNTLAEFVDSLKLASTELSHTRILKQGKDKQTLPEVQRLFAQNVPQVFRLPHGEGEQQRQALEWELVRLFKLSEEQWSPVRSFSEAIGVKPQVVIAAVFIALLARYPEYEMKAGVKAIGKRGRSITWFDCSNAEGRTLRALIGQVKEALPNDKEASSYQLLLQIPNLPLENKEAAVPDAVVSFREEGEACIGGIKYSPILCDSISVELTLRQFLSFLTNLLQEPDTVIDQVPLMSGEEESFLLECAGYDEEVAFEQSLYERFAHSASLDSDAVAVIHESGNGETDAWSFRELSTAVDRLALRISSLGIAPGSSIGVYGERSIHTIVSILAIFKLGLTYVPLDGSYPEAQILYMIQDAGLVLILDTDSRECFIDSGRVPVLRLDGPDPISGEIGEDGGILPDTLYASDGASLILYTSGSTGTPKGVRHRQQQLINYFNHMWTRYPFRQGDRTCQRTSMNFMPSMWEFLGALLQGITTVILSDTVVKDPGKIIHALDKHKVSCCTMLPSMLRRMFESSEDLTVLKQVRMWMTVGEPFTLDLFKPFMKHFPDALLVADYGATEVNGIMQFTTADCDLAEGKMAWFRPITNVKAYILDSRMRLCPVGVPGELHIGGASLAVEYVNRQEETAAKFTNNPLRGSAGERLYKMGDMARYLPDGTIQLLGRQDHQVKIRGIRIELSAVEKVLGEVERIQECAVVAKESGNGTKRLVAFLALKQDAVFSDEEVRGYLGARLPEFMVPSSFIVLKEMPRTPNGKLDRHRLIKADTAALVRELEETAGKAANAVVPPVEASAELDHDTVRDELLRIATEILGGGPDEIKPHHKYYEVGFDSMTIVDFMNRIKALFAVKLEVTDFYDHPSIKDLVMFLAGKGVRPVPVAPPLPEPGTAAVDTGNASQEASSSGLAATDDPAKPEDDVSTSRQPVDRKVAVIGLSCRFPGARNAEEYWSNLAAGVCSVTEIPAGRWEMEAFYDPDLKKPFRSASKWGGFMQGIDQFDSDFFRISPRESEMMDPQQRLILEECWKAMEDAGYQEKELSDKAVGVYIGGRPGDYVQLIRDRQLPHDHYTTMGNDNAILSARISYYLNLKGPCITVDTACSSSLTAIHLACSDIAAGESEMAFAGGVSVMSSPALYYQSSSMGMFSPDGQCKAFDNEANGMVPGEGVGIVILKSLDRALEDGDHIYGVIVASGINQDGKTNGITAPSAASQQQLIRNLYAKYKLDPERISYIEAHGTGTKLGDPIEIKALTEAFAGWTDRKGYCAVGSVKTNIGHTIACSGVAGLVKVLLAMKHKKLPPSLHFKNANEHIDFAGSPFYVNTALKDWEAQGPRMAAVSSFGISGTNVHLVVEEVPHAPRGGSDSLPYHIVPLSAKTKRALMAKAGELAVWLDKEGSGYTLDEIGYTLQAGRSMFDCRAAFVAAGHHDLKRKLEAFLNGEELPYIYSNLRPQAKAQAEEHGPYRQDTLVRRLGKAGLEREEYRNIAGQIAVWFVQGQDIDWNLIPRDGRLGRISMPVYPFERQSYWIAGTSENRPQVQLEEKHANPDQKLHPYLGENASTLKEQRFRTVFSLKDAEVREHVIHGAAVLPAAVMLEMARAAGESACEQKIHLISSIVWKKELRFTGESKQVAIHLSEREAAVHFTITEQTDDGPQTVCQGKLEPDVAPRSAARYEKTASILDRCTRSRPVGELYASFAEKGIRYGAGYQVVKTLAYNGNELLARLELPDGQAGQTGGEAPYYELLPQMLDGAMHAMGGFDELFEADHSYVPFMLGQLELYRPLGRQCWTHIRLHRPNEAGHGIIKADIDVFDEQSELCLSMKDFVIKAITTPGKTVVNITAEPEVLFFEGRWKSKELLISSPAANVKNIMVFGSEEYRVPAGALAEQRVIVVKQGTSWRQLSDTMYEVGCEYADYSKLMDVLFERGFRPDEILHLWTLDTGMYRDPSVHMEAGVYSLYLLTKAYMHGPYSSETVRLVYAYSGENNDAYPHYAGVNAFLRTAAAENPRFRTTSVMLEPDLLRKDWAACYARLSNELNEVSGDSEVMYSGPGRSVKVMESVELRQVPEAGPVYRGTYVITGGLGGIGYQLACRMLADPGCRVIVIGRSELDEVRKRRLQQLQTFAGEAHYIQGDIASYREARSALQECRKRYGPIQGVFHCAGVTRDALLFHKERHDFDAVLQSKVWGTLNLDELTASDDLEFFVLFSSISSVFGNAGQSDYAYANRFMDEFAAGREQKRLNGLRSGKSLAVNWPLWADGGLQLTEAYKKKLRMELGMAELGSRAGIAALEQALQSPYPCLAVLAGDPELLLQRTASRLFIQPGGRPKQLQPYAAASAGPHDRLSALPGVKAPVKAPEDDAVKLKRVEELLIGLVATETRLPAGKVQPQRSMDEYGLNSLMIMNMTGELISQFGALPQTVFFEHRNLKELGVYLVKAYPDQTAKLCGEAEDLAVKEPEQKTGERFLPEDAAAGDPAVKEQETSLAESAGTGKNGDKDERIAIIGISGRYPMARTLEDYWNNLKSGRDCIAEIPADRWDLHAFFDPNKEAKGKSYTKWGGFLDGMEEFDPLFFNISPKEAELMDPQERLFLECAWETLEDAGYTRKALDKAKVGVYVGAMWSQYQLYGASGDEREKPTSSFSSIANRVSYVMDFTGPSMAVDTMCSSSLTAIKLACDSLARGEADYALAGGVNVASHPNKYILVSQGKFGSTDGRCRSFGEGGDGYVPGEGVGAVLLKPLAQAVRDGDSIYGVIAGTSLNHGGKTNGYTVPSPVSQAELLSQAFHESGIDPRTISYLEAHGTGTALGDPIEIEGINRAFASFTEDKGFCAIGSVKSNVGHLESAAGIAALTKVLLQMREQMLVPSLHAEQLNPRIDFRNSPVRVQRECSEWRQPVRTVNGKQERYPRRAGISSFGAGGSNAFLVIEEYAEEQAVSGKRSSDNRQSASIAVLSARTRERLSEYAGIMKAFVDIRRLQEGAAAGAEEPAAAYSLLEYIEAVTGGGQEQLDAGEMLGDVLGTAADIMQFASGINQRFGVELNLHDVAGGLTVGGLDKLIADARRQREGAAATAVLQPLRTGAGVAGCSLQDFVYTLQTGREHFEERLAIICEDFNELSDLLDVYLQGGDAPGLYSGCAADKLLFGQVPALDLDPELVDLTARDRLNDIARSWTEGSEIPWKKLFSNSKRRPVRLPTYPFSRERYWVETRCTLQATVEATAADTLLPFIDANVSTFEGLAYTKLFDRENALIQDHIVQGAVLVPGAAMIEMARSAGSLAKPGTIVAGLKHAMWFSPLDVTAGSKQATIMLTPDGNQAKYTIVTGVQGEQTVHFKGTLSYGNAAPGNPLDLSMIRKRCLNLIFPAELYSGLHDRGLQYGPGYQVMAELYHNEVEALGHIQLPSGSRQYEGGGGHPAIWDGALHSVAALAWGESAEQAGLPFAIEEIAFYGALPNECWVYTVKGSAGYDITICDMSGNRLAQMDGFRLTGTPGPKKQAEDKGLMYVREQWKPVKLAIQVPSMKRSLLIFDDDNARFEHIRDELSKSYSTIVRVRPGTAFRRTESGFELNLEEQEGYLRLFQSLRESSLRDFQIMWLWSETNAGDASGSYNVDHVHRSAQRLLCFTKAIAGAGGSEQTKILFAYTGQHPEWESSCAAAFVKSVCLESKQAVYRTVRVHDRLQAAELAQLLYREVNAIQQSFAEIAYTGGIRMMRLLEEADIGLRLNADIRQHAGSSPRSHAQERPVYVITGGAGGLGLVFARYLASLRPCILVLAGRSELNSEKQAVLEQLGETAEISYLSCDLSDAADTRRLFQIIGQRYGAVHGVIHAAGVTRDSLVKGKSEAELQAVLAPKVNGIFHVDEVTKEEPLEFFVAFSSIAAVAGSRGQADYAFANRYMDEYMEHRQQLTNIGRRSGVSLSVNWPLWQEGGMVMPAAVSARMEEETGLSSLQTDRGVRAFEAMLGAGYPRLTVAEGRLNKVRDWLFPPQDLPAAEASRLEADAAAGLPGRGDDPAPEQVAAFVKEMISRTTKVAVERIRDTDTFDRYGMDSVMLMGMGRELGAVIGADAQTVFVEYNSVRQISGWLLSNHRERLAAYFRKDCADAVASAPSTPWTPSTPAASANPQQVRPGAKEVAVIGLSGKYPEAETAAEFWSNLSTGKNCIREVPAERWNGDLYMNAAADQRHMRSNGKWGGFIKDVDRFDPLFFNISPKEAVGMDPQERIMLETVWHALEDAGYSRAKLNRLEKEGRRVGVFIGAMTQPYPWVAKDKQVGAILSGASYWSIANRISYYLGIQGPSMAVDTACSSSLAALHLAVNSLRLGECAMAIVGGVNLSLHPYKYIGLSQAKLLGSHSRSLSMGDGDGYLPGEGAGVVILKLAEPAEADHDRILCRIKGSAVNHSGRTSAYKVPSGDAQAELIRLALADAGAEPATIGYVETAANGSAVGDAIEMDALKLVFQDCSADSHVCAVGSVKSNIGHLEAASGMSQLTKVIMQLVNRKLVPSLHADSLNPRIDLTGTVLQIQRETADWGRLRQDGDDGFGPEIPLRAVIHAVGAGGTNAALVVEEHLPTLQAELTHEPETAGPFLLLMSARNAVRLGRVARNLLEYLTSSEYVSMRDLAYSLALREPMEERLALVVQDKQAAVDALERVLGGSAAGTGIFAGSVEEPGIQSRLRATDVTTARLSVFAERWVHGIELVLDDLYPPEECFMLPLPGYPFERESYWVASDLTAEQQLEPAAEAAPDRTASNQAAPDQVAPDREVSSEIRDYLTELLAELLDLKAEQIKPGQRFDKYGMDSLTASSMVKAIRQFLGITVTLPDLFEHYSIERLSGFLMERGAPQTWELPENLFSGKDATEAEPEGEASFDYYLNNLILSSMEDNKLQWEEALALKDIIKSFVESGETNDRKRDISKVC
ncbi:hypothetical protein A3844_17655 [Paenibacillus helianthi]|uniref:Amino acid adenylation domain-containing protein n=1 Tax=Paenibacillus helianthi TaxID=1349432 RepID=A0ABX3ENK5_9BACL|nr:amino acid adenylation domain-containing protein [Paenibacillus helianthi]OKP85081.1 hypothetical protein A3844_17655 [Paenibacillus helianthi]